MPRAGNGSGAIRWRRSRRACAAGLNTIELAKPHGGQGLSFCCKLRAFEEIAAARLRVRLRADQPSQRLRALRPRRPAGACRAPAAAHDLTGEVIGCAGLSEPDVGSDFGGLEMTAVRAAGGWTLNGAKAWITNAAVAGPVDRLCADRQGAGLSRDRLFRHRGRAAGLPARQAVRVARRPRDRRRRLPPGRLFRARRGAC